MPATLVLEVAVDGLELLALPDELGRTEALACEEPLTLALELWEAGRLDEAVVVRCVSAACKATEHIRSTSAVGIQRPRAASFIVEILMVRTPPVSHAATSGNATTHARAK